jgi:hypothetical protein
MAAFSRPATAEMTAGYFAYLIGDDGHIRNRVEIACDDEGEARRCAKMLLDGHAVELWQESRLIERLAPEVSPADAAGPASGLPSR